MKDINAIRRQLSKSFVAISLVFIGLIFVFWLVIFVGYYANQKILITEQLNATITVYKTNLSEKLSIMASSPIFEQYLKSGPNSRDDLYIRFLNEISTLEDSSIVGMEINYTPSPLMKGIESSQKNMIFHHGDTNSPHYVDLLICYLNDRLDSVNGICQNTWRLYFSKKKFVDSLKKINRDIEICHPGKCDKINAISSKTFGSFPTINASTLPVNLKIKEHTSLLLYLISIITILLFFLLIFFIREKTRKLMNSAFADPLNNIISSLKKGSLPETKGYIEELEYLCNQIKEYYKEKDKIEIARVASQAAHDIRSPLAALEIAIKNLSLLPEQQRILIRNAIAQIHDIANNLLQQNASKEAINYSATRNVMLIPIIEYVLSEKNTELSEINSNIKIESLISPETYTIFVKVIPLELKRILSNLFNNAIEAMKNKRDGHITIKAKCENNLAIIEISDNGPGIPENIINNVFAEGVSSKKEGSGLGLFHAKINIEKWNGIINIASKCSEGTTISLSIPKQTTAKWFANYLTLASDHKLVIIDDSESIHNTWRQRLIDDGLNNITLEYFSTSNDFISWYNSTDNKCIYLVDYEFSGEKSTGIDIIKQMRPSDQKFLVTSRAEDFNIQEQCENLRIKLIPKYYVPTIPFKQIDTNANIVLIEKNQSLVNAWIFRASKKGISIACYSSSEDFITDFKLYSKNIKIYLSDEYINIIPELKKHGYYSINIITHHVEQYKDLNDVTIHNKHFAEM